MTRLIFHLFLSEMLAGMNQPWIFPLKLLIVWAVTHCKVAAAAAAVSPTAAVDSPSSQASLLVNNSQIHQHAAELQGLLWILLNVGNHRNSLSSHINRKNFIHRLHMVLQRPLWGSKQRWLLTWARDSLVCKQADSKNEKFNPDKPFYKA